MEHDWRVITSDLYAKIKPIGGTLSYKIGSDFRLEETIKDLIVEFEMNDFMYMDPFYGEQKSTAPFKMFIELGEYISTLKLKSIYEIENVLIKGKPEDSIGAFSNSLHFTVPHLKLGVIKDLTIEVYMEYSMTNSDSYGMMTGYIKDHISQKGSFKTTLAIKEF